MSKRFRMKRLVKDNTLIVKKIFQKNYSINFHENFQNNFYLLLDMKI